jgi:hypothetical protein
MNYLANEAALRSCHTRLAMIVHHLQGYTQLLLLTHINPVRTIFLQATGTQAIRISVHDDFHFTRVDPCLFAPAIFLSLAGEKTPTGRTTFEGSLVRFHRVKTTLNLSICPPIAGFNLDTVTVTFSIRSDTP